MSTTNSLLSSAEVPRTSIKREAPQGHGLGFRSLPYEIKKMILELHLYQHRVIHVKAKFWRDISELPPTSRRITRGMVNNRYSLELEINLAQVKAFIGIDRQSKIIVEDILRATRKTLAEFLLGAPCNNSVFITETMYIGNFTPNFKLSTFKQPQHPTIKEIIINENDHNDPFIAALVTTHGRKILTQFFPAAPILKYCITDSFTDHGSYPSEGLIYVVEGSKKLKLRYVDFLNPSN